MAGNAEKITDETEVSTTELAVVLGVSARRVQQMAQDGTVPTCRKAASVWLTLSSDISSSSPMVRWTMRTRSWKKRGAWQKPQ